MEAVDFMGLQGKSLTVGEKTALTCSLPLLQQQHGKAVTFWGKVLGVTHNDYLVVQVAGDEFLDQATSFYSVDGGTHWVQMKAPDELQIEFSGQIRGPFSGDPNYEYKLQKDLPPEDPAAVDDAAKAAEAAALAEKAEDEEGADEDDEAGEDEADGEQAAAEEDVEEEEKKPTKKRAKFQIISMAESIRLSYFVIEHDRACKLVPRGAFLRGGDNIITKNRAFKGLSVEEATSLKFYFKKKENYSASPNTHLFKENTAVSRDFLCSIADDVPRGMWTVKYDSTQGVAVVLNLFFLGSMTYHVAETNQFGQVYVGTGERNLDMLFMLP